jgi:hypothetical protein
MNNLEFQKIIKEKDLTTKEVANELCVSNRAVYLWISGERKIPLSIQKLFCLIYDIDFKMNSVQNNNEFEHPFLFDIQ